jgi:ribonuclease VapC
VSVVLDASVVLAWLQREPGGAEVKGMLDDGLITAANWSEVLQKVRQHGGDPDEVGLLLRALGLEVADVTRPDGEHAARLWRRENPLSLADRLCLAVAHRLGVPAVTAESRWVQTDLAIDIRLIR